MLEKLIIQPLMSAMIKSLGKNRVYTMIIMGIKESFKLFQNPIHIQMKLWKTTTALIKVELICSLFCNIPTTATPRAFFITFFQGNFFKLPSQCLIPTKFVLTFSSLNC